MSPDFFPEAYDLRLKELQKQQIQLVKQFNVYNSGLIPEWQMTDELSKLASVYLVWLFVMRFKRVEVQVVRDARETTPIIFKKLKCTFVY